MTPQALQHILANDEDTRHQFKRGFTHADSLLNTGVSRVVAVREAMQLQDNQPRQSFKAIVQRIPSQPNQDKKASEGVSEGVNALHSLILLQPGLRTRVLAQTLQTSPKNVERWLGQLRQTGAIEFRGAPKTRGYYVLRAAPAVG